MKKYLGLILFVSAMFLSGNVFAAGIAYVDVAEVFDNYQKMIIKGGCRPLSGQASQAPERVGSDLVGCKGTQRGKDFLHNARGGRIARGVRGHGSVVGGERAFESLEDQRRASPGAARVD